MYGLMLLLAIAACIGLTGVALARRGGGDWDLVFRVAVWGVAAGIVGARLYHVITSWDEVPDEWWGVFAVWKGGLGVWGGIVLGVVVGASSSRASGESVRAFMDAVAPGLLLAQAIGRWGNWWNQELFGKPTDLPWGLEIDPEHRPPDDFAATTFHPTFLYEFVYNLIGVGILLLVDRRFRIRPPGAVRALRRVSTRSGRFFEELLRVDPAHELGPLRLNALGVGRPVRRARSRSSCGGSSSAKHADSPKAGAAREPPRSQGPRWRSPRAASDAPVSLRAVVVRELELDLDAFEGPFDLLLTLVLKRGARPGRGGRGRGSSSRSSSGSPSATSSTSTPAASSSSSWPRCSS